MKYENKNVSGINIAYIGGGSRGWAWGFMTDLAMDEQLCGTVKLYDIDRKAADNNTIIGSKISAHSDSRSRWEYLSVGSLQEALTDADFVVISILPGTFEEMHSDVHLPERLGILQAVGDTIGPGGFVRALRTIPMYVEIAKAIKQYSPEAWVINYTNPMSLCVRTMYEVFPKVRAFGCCHEVFGTQQLLSHMLEDMRGIENVTRNEIKVNVMGINHFTWFDSASYKGVNLFPIYEEFVEKYYETGFDDDDDKHWMNASFACRHRVKFDLFRNYGYIAAAGDRHLAEFMPEYLKDKETVAEYKFAVTTVDWRMQDLTRRLKRSEDLISGREAIELKATGEEGHLLIKALLGLGDLISNVNIPNFGQISNLPMGAVVETNALFRRGEIRPVFAGALPEGIKPLVARHAINQENTLTAALTGDYKLALNTFMNDPMLNGVSRTDADELLRDMIKNTQKYLPNNFSL